MYLCNEKSYSHSQFWGTKQAKKEAVWTPPEVSVTA